MLENGSLQGYLPTDESGFSHWGSLPFFCHHHPPSLITGRFYASHTDTGCSDDTCSPTTAAHSRGSPSCSVSSSGRGEGEAPFNTCSLHCLRWCMSSASLTPGSALTKARCKQGAPIFSRLVSLWQEFIVSWKNSGFDLK